MQFDFSDPYTMQTVFFWLMCTGGVTAAAGIALRWSILIWLGVAIEAVAAVMYCNLP